MERIQPLSLEFRRAMGLVALALALSTLGACGSKQAVPTLGQADADVYLFQRGTELLAKKNWLTAREYFRRLVDSYPQSRLRADAKLGIGDSYLGEGRIESYILGANEFREFLTFFPSSPRADYAVYRLGYAQSKQMLKAERDQTATHEALRELQRFLDSYPDSKYRPEVEKLHRQARDRLSESEFRKGLLYYRIRNPVGAVSRFAELLKADPTYSKNDAVYYYLAESYVKLNVVPEALPLYDRLLKEFPKSEYRKKAEKRLAELKKASGGSGG
jgi:outer membrane protein assembly factor BamD